MSDAEKKVIELFHEMGRGQGLNDSLMLTLFARLYMEPEPIAMEDLAKETGYSLASISTKVNILVPFHIEKIRKPGSKKVYLYMQKDMIKLWKDALIKKEEWVIKRVKERLPSIIKEFKEKAKTDQEKKKVKILENYYQQILKFEKIIAKMLKEFENIG